MSRFEIIVSHVADDGEETHHWMTLASLRASGGSTQHLPAGTLRIAPFPDRHPLVAPSREDTA